MRSLGGGARRASATEACAAGHCGGARRQAVGSSRMSTLEVSRWIRSCSKHMKKDQAGEDCNERTRETGREGTDIKKAHTHAPIQAACATS